MTNERRNSFLRGALILSLAGLGSKILGSLYRIPLTWLIGPEGMGLFQLAYPLYLIFQALSTAGLPVAVSKLVAERVALRDRAGVRSVHRAAILLLFLLGSVSALIMLTGARAFASRLYDRRAYFAIVSFAPAVFIMAVMSAWRGYFQGWQRMAPVALSQVIEQVVRVATMLILAALLMDRGVEHAAAGVALGGAAGAAAGLGYLLYTYFRTRRQLENGLGRRSKKPHDAWLMLKRMLSLSWPIAVGAVLVPLTQAVDSAMVPARLAVIGLAPAATTAAMGHLGNAWALVVFPTVVTAALSTSLVPAISDALARRDRADVRSRSSEALRVAVVIGLPSAAGLWALSPEIARLLFSQAGLGAAVPLRWLAPAALFLGLQQTTAAALQGLGRPGLPVRNFLCGAAVKVGVTYVLAARPEFGLRGAALGTVLGAVVTSALNLLAVRALADLRVPWVRGLAIPLFATTLMLVGTGYLRHVLTMIGVPTAATVLACIVSAVLMYGGVLWKTGVLASADKNPLSEALGRLGLLGVGAGRRSG